MNNSQNNQNVNQPIQMNVSQHPSHQTNQMMQQGHSNFFNQAPVQQTTVQQPQQNVQQPTAHMSTNPNATNQEMLNKTKKLISDLKESLAVSCFKKNKLITVNAMLILSNLILSIESRIAVIEFS